MALVIMARGRVAAVMLTTAEAILLLSACETAVTVTVAEFGTVAGAVYIPVEEIVPCMASPPVVPFTSQITAAFAVLETTAVNC